MKRIAGLHLKICMFMLAVILLVTGVTACGESTSTTNTAVTYRLVHNLPDLEYVFPWDTIEARCPDMNDYTKYQKEEAYMGRGNAGGFISLDSSSPAMWMIARVLNKIIEGNSVRNISIFMWYFDTESEFDEHMNTLQTQGISVQKEGEILTAVVGQKTPVQTAQLVVAGNSLCILIAEAASPDETLLW